MDDFFESLMFMSDAPQEKAITDKAKEMGVSKRALQNDFKAFISAQKEKDRAEQHKRNIEAFNGLFGLQNIILPDGFYVSDGYLCSEGVKICKAFTFLRKIQTSKTHFLELASLTDNRIIDIRDLIKNDRLAVEFGTRGEHMDGKRTQTLMQFISSFLQENETKIETIRGADKTGWNENGTFDIPNRDGSFFIDEDLKKRFSKKGNIDGEISLLKELAKGKAFMLSLFALSATFYGIIDIPINFICHVGGLTGEGKSFAIKTAMSLFGEKDLAKCGKNWNATLNGLETYWERGHCLPSWVDEMESARSILEVVGALYVFSEGTGKSRAFSKDGEVQERAIKTFKGTMFTSGEKNLSDVIQKAGETKNKPLGIVRRSLDFASVDLWDGLDRRKIGEIIDRNHGNFIDRWIAKMQEIGFDEIETRFWAIMDKQKISLDGKEYLFALLELALNILLEMGIVSEDDHKRQTKYLIDEIRNAETQIDNVKNDYLNFIDDLQSYVADNRTKIKGIVEDEELRGAIVGKFEDNYLFVTCNEIKALCARHGYVWNQIRQKLYKRAVLREMDGKNKKLMSGINPRCFCFDMQLIENINNDTASEIRSADGKLIAVLDGNGTLRDEDGKELF